MKINIEKQKILNGLYVVATPIGNLKDITLRALEILLSVDYIWCEDKRISVRLLQRYNIKTKLFTYHKHNSNKELVNIMNKLSEGLSLALISDAGTPLISDPGMKLIIKCRECNYKLFPIPGCSAPITALCVAGLTTNRFLFEGFLPNKKTRKKRIINNLKNINATLIFFESAKRLVDSLKIIVDILPNRKITVARELTKIYEEIVTLSALDIYEKFKQRKSIKGEVVLMISPPVIIKNNKVDQDVIDRALIQSLKNMRVKEAVILISKQLNLSKKYLYQRALELK